MKKNLVSRTSARILATVIAISGMALGGVSARAATVLPSVGSGTLQFHLSGDTDVTTGTTFTWGDQSGKDNDFTQSTEADQPTLVSGAFNGFDAIRFDGSDDFLTSINALESSEHNGLEKNYTLFVTAKGTNADGLLATGENRSSGNEARTGYFNETGGNSNDFENVATSGDGVGISDPYWERSVRASKARPWAFGTIAPSTR